MLRGLLYSSGDASLSGNSLALERLQDIYPNRFYSPPCRCPGDPPHSIGIFAKRAWRETGVQRVPSSNRAFMVWARFSSIYQDMTVAGVHLSDPITRPASHQQTEVNALIPAIKRFGGSVILVGDLNMTPFSARYSQMLRKSGLRRADGGLNPTWPAMLAPMALPLDHVLIGSEIRHAIMRAGPRLGSDHLPVVGVLDLRT